MKILFLTHHWSSNTHHSGHSGYQELIKYFVDDHECVIVTSGAKNEVRREGNVTVHYVKPVIKKEIFFSKRFSISRYAAGIEKDFDVVHALYSDCGYFQTHKNFYSTLHISPFVVNKVGFIAWLFLRLKNLIIEKRVFSKSRKVFLVSNNLKSSLGKRGEKAVFIPHGINTEFWDPSTLHEPTDLELPNEYVLCVGNNGVDRECLEKVVRNNKDIIFVLVGIRNLGFAEIENVVSLKGLTEDVLKDVYSRARLFIRPMTFATANNSILEAMAMNKPVLAATPDGTYDYFKNGGLLRIVKTEDFLNEFGAMLSAVRNSPTGTGTNNTIRDFTIAAYDWNGISRRIRNFYECKE